MTKRKPITLEELGEKAFAKFWANTRTPAPHRSNLNKVLEAFGPSRLVHRITAGMIEDLADGWVASGTSKKTVNRRLSALSRMLTWALQRGWIQKVPHISKYREAPGRLRWPTLEEEAEMIEFLKQADKPVIAQLVAVLADTGCRRSELLALRWEDVDGNWIRLWDTKGGTPRSIPMTKRVRAVFKERASHLHSPVGPFIDVLPRYLEVAWNAARARMGLEDDKGFTPHCLRHGCASRLVQAGVSILTVKELLGHAKLETTLVYAHLAPRNLEEAILLLEPKA